MRRQHSSRKNRGAKDKGPKQNMEDDQCTNVWITKINRKVGQWT